VPCLTCKASGSVRDGDATRQEVSEREWRRRCRRRRRRRRRQPLGSLDTNKALKRLESNVGGRKQAETKRIGPGQA
jgi:hypothetical protein